MQNESPFKGLFYYLIVLNEWSGYHAKDDQKGIHHTRNPFQQGQ